MVPRMGAAIERWRRIFSIRPGLVPGQCALGAVPMAGGAVLAEYSGPACHGGRIQAMGTAPRHPRASRSNRWRIATSGQTQEQQQG